MRRGGSGQVECPDCSGTGKKRDHAEECETVRAHLARFVAFRSPLPRETCACGIPEYPCDDCDGTGLRDCPECEGAGELNLIDGYGRESGPYGDIVPCENC